VRELFDKIPAGALRLVGVQVSGLSDVRTPIQENLFSESEWSDKASRAQAPPRAKLERATAGLDRLRKKFGRRTVVPASLLGREPLRGRDGSDGQPGVAGRHVE
jgi:hypothetical protein